LLLGLLGLFTYRVLLRLDTLLRLNTLLRPSTPLRLRGASEASILALPKLPPHPLREVRPRALASLGPDIPLRLILFWVLELGGRLPRLTVRQLALGLLRETRHGFMIPVGFGACWR
jgi:hypothetical protein